MYTETEVIMYVCVCVCVWSRAELPCAKCVCTYSKGVGTRESFVASYAACLSTAGSISPHTMLICCGTATVCVYIDFKITVAYTFSLSLHICKF